MSLRDAKPKGSYSSPAANPHSVILGVPGEGWGAHNPKGNLVQPAGGRNFSTSSAELKEIPEPDPNPPVERTENR